MARLRGITAAQAPIAIVLIALVFGAGMLGGLFLARYVGFSPAGDPEFRLIVEAWDAARQHYVDRSAANPKDMVYDAIDGMINGLGDTGHSRFLTPDEVRQQENFQKGQLEGIGVQVQERGGRVVIVAPIDGSPAQRAGLRSGDVITGVDGLPISSISDAVRRIMGPAGTSVTLTLLSPAGDTRDITLAREIIVIKSASWHMVPGTTTAHIRLASFSRGTKEGLAAALTAAKEVGATGIVLDLRDNPGGLLDQAVAVASHFLTSGNVLLERDANGSMKPVPVEASSAVSDLPMVVITNGGTASAAEIVAGALRDAGRATLVGETTFGTGTVLVQFPLADGSAVLLAVREWLTPSGQKIWHKGLDPDVRVSLPPDTTPVYPSAEEGMTREQLERSGDQQLLRALNLLGVQ